MRIITVLVGNVFLFPPVLSLLHAFEGIGVQSVLITTQPSKPFDELTATIVEEIPVNYESISSPFNKLISMQSIGKQIWSRIDKYYNEDSFIWIVTDVTLKYLGSKICERKYVLHLLELSEELLYYPKIKFLKMDKNRLGNSAKAVIVPEYNRAHLIKTWWNLRHMPFVLPNKPYYGQVINKCSMIDDPKANAIIERIGEKKIILYQGIMSKERPLDMFIKAVDKFQGKYAFVVMSGGKNIYEGINSANYYFIPFVSPPKHLQITSHAHIGVLTYVPTDTSGYSPLNSLYCAPNKTFEYSMFGIPMLGNDIPGLRYLFDTQNCGRCFERFTQKDICLAIDKIEQEYSLLSGNSYKYFESCDYKSILKKILSEIS